MSNTENRSSNPSPEEPISPNFFDKFFVTVIAFGFGLGTAIALLPNIVPLAIIPAVFYGTGIGALVYRFMGGLKSDDSVSTKTIKISGSLASLLGSIIIINVLLDSQLKTYLGENTVELISEQGQFLVVKNGNFKVGKVSPATLSQIDYYNIQDASLIKGLEKLKLKNPEHPILMEIRKQCAKKKGICAPLTKEFPLIILISNEISPGKSIACPGASDEFWEGVVSIKIYKNSDKTRTLELINLNGDCLSDTDNRRLVISDEDAKDLNIKNAEQIKARPQIE
ncbi:hypothetical protein ACN4EK_24325 [Pantanalinema rosaneae CENA516]|uniref:hypothetical protein n=1 Tax=Pantanalinema rosaneae TaxID=1620701 RepID=UPI003D6F988C